jgi:hypothetical protein
MSQVSLVFLPQDPGGGPGAYEMFIDLYSFPAPSSLRIHTPAGWSTIAIKLYTVTKNPQGKVTPNAQKQADKGSLAPGKLSNYQSVFSGVTLPAGISFDPATSTLLTTGVSDGLFEFLVWIQDVGGDNDYLDPGIRDHK